MRIPPGADTGQKVRLRRKGNLGRGGQVGDVIIRLTVDNDTPFERLGNDLHLTLPISLSEAVLGAVVQVPTLTKPARLTLPEGTSGGQRLRLKGKGIPLRTGAAGDLIVQVRVVVPPKTDDKSKSLIKEFATRNPYDPRDDISE